MELVIGLTVKLPLTGRFCGPSSLPTSTTELAFCVVHDSTTGLPAAVEVTGLAVKEVIRTAPTFTVTLALMLPVALVAVSVYVVVTLGFTTAQSLALRLV